MMSIAWSWLAASAAATVNASCRWCVRRAIAPRISSTPRQTSIRVVPRRSPCGGHVGRLDTDTDHARSHRSDGGDARHRLGDVSAAKVTNPRSLLVSCFDDRRRAAAAAAAGLSPSTAAPGVPSPNVLPGTAARACSRHRLRGFLDSFPRRADRRDHRLRSTRRGVLRRRGIGDQRLRQLRAQRRRDRWNSRPRARARTSDRSDTGS